MKLNVIAANIGLVSALATLAACGSAAHVASSPAASSVIPASAGQSVARRLQNLRAFAADCPAPALGSTSAACTNIELPPSVILAANAPASQIPGYHPSDLSAAYKLPSSTAGKGQTIAVIVAYADPNAEADLAVYRSAFGLPPCTAQNGCLKIASSGKAIAPDTTWARETATDLDMASAICPNCSLILSQAVSDKDKDLASAVTSAVELGATVVSNSFTVPEGKGETNDMWYHPHVVMVAAAGDQGYGTANWPAASTNVVAVGGTTLIPAPNTARGWSETTWSQTGSACSGSAPKPIWQLDTACAHRTVTDIAAVGDPSTPVAVYNTYQDSGWNRVGGTSVSAPIVAGIYALAGNGAALTGAASLYLNAGSLNTLTGSANGSCITAYLCTPGAGYHGPSGLGSPNGIAAF